MQTETQRAAQQSSPTHEERAKTIAGDLKKIGDAMLAKNQSATAEIRDAAKLIAAELAHTAEKIETSAAVLAALGDEARVQQHLALLDARDRITLLEHLARTALGDAERSATFIGETARVKVALARMDAVDLVAATRRAVIDKGRRLEVDTEAALRNLETAARSLQSAAAALTGGVAAAFGLAEKR